MALAAAGGVVVGGASAESGESDHAQAAKPAPHPPQVRAIQALKHDKSRPLRDITPVFPRLRPQERENGAPVRQEVAVPSLGEDPVAQTTVPATAMPAPTKSFEGTGNVDGYVPPDTNGDVGPNDYVQIVNAAFAVYDKSGTKQFGPVNINTLWSGFGGLCETENDGDPVVQYDQLADRWLVAQFAFALDAFDEPVGPYYECVAVSTSGDPAGSYYRYAFLINNTKFDDYPKIAVWPDAYYMSVNEFDDSCGGCFVGVGAVAFDRAKMIQGQNASLVYVDLDTSFYSMLPSDLDGSTLPPAGAPNHFVQFDDNAWGYVQDQLELWNFHVDFTTPANSTFTSGGTLATASFDSSMCGYNPCVVQPSTPQRLDALSDRLMYRLAYRRFSNHETMVVNHTVDVGGDRGGVRWYELRKTTGSWSIFQQSTYAPADGNSRWMGSAAMDQSGDLAIGYSVSSSTMKPGIRYAGRLVGDPTGQLTQGEATLQAGGGVQPEVSRWGDYSSLVVDPSDDCTFWYTNEYYTTTSVVDWPWHTRIGSFKFPTCGPPPTITGFTPPSGGPGTSVAITGTNLNGATAVKFNTTSATFTVDSAIHITATVPAGATDGPISVVTPRGTATSAASFHVGPSVSSFSPASGAVGTVVTVSGAHFDGATAVTFGGVAAAPTFVSSTQVKAAVPAAAKTGQIGVTNPAGTGLSSATFKVLPKLTSFGPGSGAAGASVVIAGSGFTDVSAVKFNNVAASFSADSDHQITATVPAAATTGRLTVVTAGGTATSATNFLVVPTITSFAPGSAAAGGVVLVNGTGFGGVSSVKVNGAGAGFAVLSAVQLRLTVPSGASTGAISVTTPGGTATSGSTFFVLPRVTSFSPSTAAVGATVTVNGNAFGGATSVLFNGVLAAPVTVTPTKVTVVVPADASTGKLTVVTPSGSGQSVGTFKVLPKLTSFSPGSGAAGASVTIGGSGFTDVSAVKFNGVAAGFSVDSSIQITATVPTTAITGRLTVVTAGGTATSATNFLAVPTITGFAPGSAAPASAVVVDGTGFGGVSSVKVHGVGAGFSVLSKTQLRLTVPLTATDGAISVTTTGGTATSASTLAVTPRVTGFTPSTAAVGALVTVTGNAFGGATSVLFGGVLASPATVTPTKVTALVPADAVTGKLTVVTPSGSGQSVGTFKVLPKLASFAPSSGPIGTSVGISGSGFTSVSAVRFNGHAATTFTVDTSGHITATVPLGATTGRVSVVTAGGTATSATNYTVTP